MTGVDSRVWQRLEPLSSRTVLAEGPSRRVVRYAATGQDGDETAVIAKFYGDDEGTRTARIMGAIHAALERSASPVLGVPRPLGYDANRRLLLQEPVPGVRLDALLAGPAALDSLALAGRALAALHALDADVGAPRRLRDHVDELFHPHPDLLAQELPALAPRLAAIFEALYSAESRWRPHRRDVPLHRDVHPRQLFLDGQRAWLVDWDLCARGDGALDLGNFVAWLRARRGADDQAIDALLRGYAAAGEAGVVARVPVYEALTYVRLSCKRFRLQEDGWREECAGLIARAERCIAAGA